MEIPVHSKEATATPKESRRITEEVSDLSQVDLSEPEIRRRIKGAYRVLLKYRPRRLNTQEEEV